MAAVLAPGTAMGQLKRREGLCSGLEDAGHRLDRVLIPAPRDTGPHLLRFRGLAHEDVELVRRRAEDGESVVLVEGLPLAAALLPALPRHRVVVDVCDSWTLLAGIRRRGATGVKARLRVGLKQLLAGSVVRRTAGRAAAAVFIASRDAAADGGRFARVAVVPNGIDPSLADAGDLFDPDGPFLVLGDWSYPPNLGMLRRAAAWSAGQTPPVALRVVGPGLPAGEVPVGADHRAWVPVLADVFRGCAGLLAPVDEGAGVKNKVLEAVAAGLPVVALPEALEGIPAELRGATKLVGPAEMPDLRTWASAVALDEPRRASRRAAATLDWSSSASKLADLLEETLGSGAGGVAR